jgi:hypothetical protein
MFIIIAGNISEGFRFIGPFLSFDDADEYSRKVNDTFWIATLEVK